VYYQYRYGYKMVNSCPLVALEVLTVEFVDIFAFLSAVAGGWKWRLRLELQTRAISK
jgi:hypothetical protein